MKAAETVSSAIPVSSGSFDLTDMQFGVIAKIAHENFGLSLPLEKKKLVLSRLSKRLRALSLGSFDDYLALLNAPSDGPQEVENLLSSLTTNVTHFFRERHHFETLQTKLMPALIDKARAGKKLRIWSAGCSSGQEPYSIAMSLLEACPNADTLDIKILATDIDPNILAHAAEGVYKTDLIPPQDSSLFDRYFETRADSTMCAGPKLRKLISFGRLNLIDDWPMRGPFDVLFCRNVAIYFEKETQDRLWRRFSQILAAEGHLFIGHSERITEPAKYGFTPAGVTTYRKQ